MSRDIKLRAYDTLNSRMIKDYFWIDADGDVWYDQDPHGVDMSGKKKIAVTDRLRVMQYTGIKDKNGKEIYEGDILRRSHDTSSRFVAVIEFKKGMFGGTTKPGNNHFIEMSRLHQCDYDHNGYDEVIGNAYENPELLTPSLTD